jgi:hypothetical protein
VAREQPINAGVPGGKSRSAPLPAPLAKPPSKPKPPPKQKRRRKPIPGALKAIAALFVLAIVFIAAAVVGGGSGDDESGHGPAPVGDAPGAPAEAPATQTPEDLGYPAFATANTTRIGGSDPAANAAGTALAVYPSAEPSQRPGAVTVADADDWPTAIAAAVLMAPPVGAPLLLSGADEMPDETVEALAALDPAGSAETAGAQIFALGAAAVPADLRSNRVRAGGSAGAAAIAALREKLAGLPPRHMVVASSAEPAFAMPAAAWAARSGDPILFTAPDRLDEPTAAALEANPKVPVYVLGPSAAISSNVVREIGKAGGRVRRVSGEDPVASAIALARYAGGSFGWNVNDPGHGFVVTRSDDPLGAAAAAPLSAAGTWGPLLLTDSADTLPAALRGYLLDVKPGYTDNPTRAFYNHIWVIGDREAIDVSEQAEMDELAALAKIGGGE